jgi:hypothetical protein
MGVMWIFVMVDCSVSGACGESRRSGVKDKVRSEKENGENGRNGKK